MITITLKKVSLTKSLFAQLPVLHHSLFNNNNIELLGFVSNIKHPILKSFKIFLLKFKEKYYVFPFCINVEQSDNFVIFNKDRLTQYQIWCKSADDAKQFIDDYNLCIETKTEQLFI